MSATGTDCSRRAAMGPLAAEGAPGEIRTPGLLIRSQTLYPAELRARKSHFEAIRASSANAPGRNRTFNLGIKSPLLCQLSYRCVV